MKTRLSLCLLTCLAAWASLAATLTGSFKNPDGTGSTNVVRFTPRSTPVADDDDLVVTRDVLATPDADGAFSVTLRAGLYNVSPVTTRPFVVDVPDNTNSYTLNSRITTDLTVTSTIPATNGVPLASATASGKVKVDVTVADPVVYLADTVDSLLEDYASLPQLSTTSNTLQTAISAVSTASFVAKTNGTAVGLTVSNAVAYGTKSRSPGSAGTSLVNWGDSLSVNASDKWGYLLAQENGWTFSSVAVGGARIYQQISQVLGLTVATNSTFATLQGVNDSRYTFTPGADDRVNTFYENARHNYAWLAIAETKKMRASAAATTGSWATESLYSFGKYSTTQNDTLTFTNIIGTTVYLGYFRSTESTGGTFTVSVDGGAAYGPYYCYGANPGPSITNMVAGLVRIPRLASGPHTVVVTVTSSTSASNPVYLGWAGGSSWLGGGFGPRVFVGNAIRIYNTATWGGSLQQTAAVNKQTRRAVTELAADGLQITYVDVSGSYDPATDTEADGLHPSAAGYAKIARLFGDYISPLATPSDRQSGLWTAAGDYLELGWLPALAGTVRLPADGAIVWRNSANTADGSSIAQESGHLVLDGSQYLDAIQKEWFVGADDAANTLSNNTEKNFYLTHPSYATATSPTISLRYQTVSGSTAIHYGGGYANAYAVTTHRFYTASGQTTTTGTEALRIYNDQSVSIGPSTSATPATRVLRTTDASGADTVGGALAIKGGRGTGSAVGGTVTIETTPAGSSGSSLNTSTERVRVGSSATGDFSLFNLNRFNSHLPRYLLGADDGATTRTDNTEKNVYVAVPSYATASSDWTLLRGQAVSGTSALHIGGGDGSSYAATTLRFYTANNQTTAVGTEAMRILNDQSVVIGPSTGSAATRTLRTTDGTGTDVAGGSLNIYAGRGTGTGAGGSLIFGSAPAGSTGSSLNSIVEKLRINESGVRVNAGAYLQLLSAAGQTVSAGTTISPSSSKATVAGNGGAVTMTSTPTVSAGVDGQVIVIIGGSSVNTVTLQDSGTLASSGLSLGAPTRTLATGDSITLIYDSSGTEWIEVGYQSRTGPAYCTTLDIGNTDTTLARSAAGVMSVEGVVIPNKNETMPTTSTLSYSGTTVTLTAGGRQEYAHSLIVTNAFTLTISGATDGDRGIIYCWPAVTTNCAVTLTSPARAPSGGISVTAAGSASAYTNYTAIAWQVGKFQSTNIITVNGLNYQ